MITDTGEYIHLYCKKCNKHYLDYYPDYVPLDNYKGLMCNCPGYPYLTQRVIIQSQHIKSYYKKSWQAETIFSLGNNGV